MSNSHQILKALTIYGIYIQSLITLLAHPREIFVGLQSEATCARDYQSMWFRSLRRPTADPTPYPLDSLISKMTFYIMSMNTFDNAGKKRAPEQGLTTLCCAHCLVYDQPDCAAGSAADSPARRGR